MNLVKRVEIIIDHGHASRIIRAIDKTGLKGYTAIANVSGRGDRGERRGDDPSGMTSNVYILTTCEPDQLATLTDAIQPALTKYGGMCLVSDAEWLTH